MYLKAVYMTEKKDFACLHPETNNILQILIKRAEYLHKYVLVVGSALALQLCHRKSEDLDFFTFSDNYSKKEILNSLKYFNERYQYPRVNPGTSPLSRPIPRQAAGY